MNVALTKSIVGFVVGACASTCTSTMVNNLVPQETTLQKVIVFTGKLGIGMAVSAAVRTQTDQMINEIDVAMKQIQAAKT